MRTHADVARRCRRAGLRPRLWLSLCLAPVACGGGSSSDDPDAGGSDAGPADAAIDRDLLSCEPQPGSRLYHVVRQHGDGTTEFLRIHDSEFAEACNFAPASDGALRCLPVVDGSPFADGVIRYTDDACTNAIGRLDAPASEPAPAYMRELRAPEACADATTALFYYELGDEIAIAPDTTIFVSNGKTCAGELAVAADYFALTPLSIDRFHEGTRSFTESGRIGVGQIEGQDGSLFCDSFGALIDRDLANHGCAIGVGEDGSTRCLPIDVGPSQAFSDDVCTTLIDVALLDECNEDATYAVDSAGAVCSLRRRIRTIDGPLPAQPYQGNSKACLQLPPEPVAHGIGASVSPFSFAEMIRDRVSAGGNRLERLDLVTADGLRLAQRDWFDLELGVPCAFAAAADGTQRCLPIDSPLELTATVIQRFSEGTCTDSISVAARDSSCVKGDPLFALEAIGEGRRRVHEIGDAEPGPLFLISGKSCVEDASGQAFYQLGPERLAQDFVGGTEAVVNGLPR
jgi:hypothetical protein